MQVSSWMILLLVVCLGITAASVFHAVSAGTETAGVIAVDCNPVLRTEGPDNERRRHIADLALLQADLVDTSHLLWTMEMVLERYGVPDTVGRHEGCAIWHYEWNKFYLSLDFVDGRVQRTDFSSEN